MLRDLQRNGKIELTLELKRLVQARRPEAIEGNVEMLLRYPLAVDAEIVVYAVACEGFEPGSVPAPEIDYAAGSDPLHDQRDDGLCRDAQGVGAVRKVVRLPLEVLTLVEAFRQASSG